MKQTRKKNIEPKCLPGNRETGNPPSGSLVEAHKLTNTDEKNPN